MNVLCDVMFVHTNFYLVFVPRKWGTRMKTNILPYPTKSGRIYSSEVVINHRVDNYGPF